MQSLTENCSHEIKRCFLLGRKAMANLGRILKIRDITLPTKVLMVKDMVLPVVIYGCESWTINKAEHQRCFQNVVLENTFESLLHSKIKSVRPKGNQPWLFIGRTDTEAEAPIPWPPGVKSQLTEKILMLGEAEGGRRRGWQRMRWLDGIIGTTDMSLSKPRGILKRRESQCAAVHGIAKRQTQLSHGTAASKTYESTWLLDIVNPFLFKSCL